MNEAKPTKSQLLKQKILQYRKELTYAGLAITVAAVILSSKKAPTKVIAETVTESYDLFQFSALTEHTPELLPKLTELVAEYNVQDLITFTI